MNEVTAFVDGQEIGRGRITSVTPVPRGGRSRFEYRAERRNHARLVRRFNRAMDRADAAMAQRGTEIGI